MKAKERLRNWIKRKFELYDIKDLVTGGHCGCCGAWMNNEILPKDWPWGICSECTKGSVK